jgi:hypothetical protein
MRKIFCILFLVLPVVAFSSGGGRVSGTCEECPPGAHCSVSFWDGCNTTSCGAWCVGGKWYHSDVCMSTLVYCSQEIEFTPAMEFRPANEKLR